MKARTDISPHALRMEVPAVLAIRVLMFLLALAFDVAAWRVSTALLAHVNR